LYSDDISRLYVENSMNSMIKKQTFIRKSVAGAHCSAMPLRQAHGNNTEHDSTAKLRFFVTNVAQPRETLQIRFSSQGSKVKITGNRRITVDGSPSSSI